MLRLYVPREEQPRVLEASVVRCEKVPIAERGDVALPVGIKLDQPPEEATADCRQPDQHG